MGMVGCGLMMGVSWSYRAFVWELGGGVEVIDGAGGREVGGPLQGKCDSAHHPSIHFIHEIAVTSTSRGIISTQQVDTYSFQLFAEQPSSASSPPPRLFSTCNDPLISTPSRTPLRRPESCFIRVEAIPTAFDSANARPPARADEGGRRGPEAGSHGAPVVSVPCCIWSGRGILCK